MGIVSFETNARTDCLKALTTMCVSQSLTSPVGVSDDSPNQLASRDIPIFRLYARHMSTKLWQCQLSQDEIQSRLTTAQFVLHPFTTIVLQ